MTKLPFTITLICMEPSRPAAVAEIVARINAEADLPVRIVFHAHESAELTLPGRREAVGDHIGASDLVVISHVLLDEEVEPLELLVRRRRREDATVLGISSAGSLMRLTRVGRFAMKSRRDSGVDDRTGGPSKLRELFRKIAGERDITPYLKELLVVAPKLLRLIPGKMQDVRSYLESYLYFVECSDRNIRSMFLMLADRYHEPLRGRLAGRYETPVIYPSEGIYHPDADAPFASREEYLAWYRNRGAGLVGLIVLRGDMLMGETSHIDAMIRAFESRGIGVIAAFGSSFDYRVAVEKMMLDARGAGIDAIVSLTAFPLVGGHVRSDVPSSVAALTRYGVPYFSPVPLLFQTIDEWRESSHGVSPVQTALHISLPELEGAIEPIVASGVAMTAQGKVKMGIEERTEKLVRRVERWIALRRKENAAKRIAITIFSFPPSKGSVGTAAYLDVFRSLHNTLRRLKDEGYTVDLPESPEAMIEGIVTGADKLAPLTSAELNVGGRLTVEEYLRLCPEAERGMKLWGPPPGALNSDGRDLLIYGRSYGNVFVGVQPSFGFEGDPMRLLFAHGASPHHGFLAYYTWISHRFEADAHLHFGTHGALEFMPGKQAGLDGGCWPDILTGDLPNIYLYSINNPSEGTIAKRRSLATLVGYLTPPLETAGLYRELGTMKSMVAAYRDAPEGDPRRELTLEALIEKTDQLNLEKDVPPPSPGPRGGDEFVARLNAHLVEIESRLIPTGLHIVGEPPAREELADLLLAIAEYDRPERGVRSLVDLIAGSTGDRYADLYQRAESGDERGMERYLEVRRVAHDAITAMLGAERSMGMGSSIARSGTGEIPAEIARGIASIESRTGGKGIAAAELHASISFLLSIARTALEEHELDTTVTALAGQFVEPGIGGDPVRNPEALPSGRNIHALDPAAVPSYVAKRNGRRVVDLMLAKHYEERGCYPESIGMVLWGLDNIKTQGEALAQAFALVGVEPMEGTVGRISRLRVIPLEELGRPRIDVTIQASGIFRDIFGLQLEMLDEAFHLAAALEEPESMNFVRKRSQELMRKLGISAEEAAIRVFSNAAGAYGTNIDHAVSMSSWQNGDELAEIFTRRKSFAYGKGFRSQGARGLFEELAGGIDATFQNLDSSEVGITDVDHYFEYLGGFSNVVERKRGVRPAILVADTTTARAKVRTLEATIRLEVRTKILNPKWFEGMLDHGYQGVEEIRKRLDYTFGFSATAGAVDPWVYDSVYTTYVADGELRERMRTLNIHAYGGLIRRLIEAEERGFWRARPEQSATMRDLCNEIEDRLEGVE